jgi:hypothetical protein
MPQFLQRGSREGVIQPMVAGGRSRTVARHRMHFSR